VHLEAQRREHGQFAKPMLFASSFTEMMELDITTAKAL